MLAVGAVSGHEQQASVAGDVAAFGAAVAVVGYLQIGRRLRTFMPIFVYAWPVTGVAAAVLTAGGLAFERHTLVGDDGHGVLGWLASTHYAPFVVYLAVAPGLVGHTGFNTLLAHMTALQIGLACSLEPAIGSLIGWAAGVMAAPGAFTYVGGAVVLGATIWVTVATAEREQRQQAKVAGLDTLEKVFSQEELGELWGQDTREAGEQLVSWARGVGGRGGRGVTCCTRSKLES